MDEKEQLELEDLAKKFIIGYNPLTPHQKRILRNIDNLELEYSELEKRQTRITHILGVLYRKLQA